MSCVVCTLFETVYFPKIKGPIWSLNKACIIVVMRKETSYILIYTMNAISSGKSQLSMNLLSSSDFTISKIIAQIRSLKNISGPGSSVVTVI